MAVEEQRIRGMGASLSFAGAAAVGSKKRRKGSNGGLEPNIFEAGFRMDLPLIKSNKDNLIIVSVLGRHSWEGWRFHSLYFLRLYLFFLACIRDHMAAWFGLVNNVTLWPSLTQVHVLCFKISHPSMSQHPRTPTSDWEAVGPSALAHLDFGLRKFLLGGGYAALLGAPWPISHDLGLADMLNTMF